MVERNEISYRFVDEHMTLAQCMQHIACALRGDVTVMAKLTDHEISSLIANALHRSGPDGNPERLSLRAAYARAAIVINAIHGAGAIVTREEQRFGRVDRAPDAGPVEANEAG
jgi:hypothetical protein